MYIVKVNLLKDLETIQLEYSFKVLFCHIISSQGFNSLNKKHDLQSLKTPTAFVLSSLPVSCWPGIVQSIMHQWLWGRQHPLCERLVPNASMIISWNSSLFSRFHQKLASKWAEETKNTTVLVAGPFGACLTGCHRGHIDTTWHDMYHFEQQDNNQAIAIKKYDFRLSGRVPQGDTVQWSPTVWPEAQWLSCDQDLNLLKPI